MTNTEHRLGVSEVSLVVRHLKLETTTKETLEQALAEIDQVYGIDAVSFDEKSHARHQRVFLPRHSRIDFRSMPSALN